MNALRSEELLEAWEQGLERPPLQRALVILAAAYPELGSEQLLSLSIGGRDSLLLRLREYLFGRTLQNAATCPECRQRVEWESTTTDFLIQDADDSTGTEDLELTADGYRITFGLPNSRDLSVALAVEDEESAGRALLSRCVRRAEFAGSHCDVESLPGSVVTSLNEQIASADPQADLRVSLTCPHCSHVWQLRFDIASYLWTEINDWAQRTLSVVGRLAAAFGWSERDILNLSPARRRAYLGMLDR